MARQVMRISELPEAGPLTGDELIELVQDGENKRVSALELSGGAAPVQSVQGRTGDVVITADDVGLGNVDNTSDADKPVSTAQQAALDGKVDKVAGMGLSSNDFTDPLRDKLIGLEGTHWRGTFVSLAALQAGVTDPAAGDYADVDAVGADVERYIWDATDGIWVAQSGSAAPITASQVKLLYESNPDTNAFTDADKAKLDGIEEGATANSTDAYLLNRANHTGTQAISTVAGLQGELDGRVLNNDSRLTNSREWIAETVPQAEAEAGTSTTRRAWTAQRVRQAIAAWWNSTASASGKAVATGTPAQGRTALGADDASNLTTGTLPDERVSKTLPASKAYRQGNILGTVSQSDGVPTGAIIERGSNANGEYIRFADGTQICTKIHQQTVDITSDYDSSRMYVSALQTIPYPATFASQPRDYITPIFSTMTPRVTGAVVSGVDPTDWQIQFTALASGTNLNARFMLLSIGRWY